MALIATPGAANANAYLTLSEANAYLTGNRLFTDVWQDATDPNKEVAIIWATMLLDRFIEWSGSIWTLTQALRWPRSGAQDQDNRWIAYDTVPSIVKQATAELALLVIQKDRTAEPDLLGQGFSQLSIDGVLSLTVDAAMVLPLIPTSILALLAPVGQWSGAVPGVGARVVPLIRS